MIGHENKMKRDFSRRKNTFHFILRALSSQQVYLKSAGNLPHHPGPDLSRRTREAKPGRGREGQTQTPTAPGRTPQRRPGRGDATSRTTGLGGATKTPARARKTRDTRATGAPAFFRAGAGRRTHTPHRRPGGRPFRAASDRHTGDDLAPTRRRDDLNRERTEQRATMYAVAWLRAEGELPAPSLL